MSEVVGEAVYKIRTDESGVDFDGAGQRAGTAFGSGFAKTGRRVITGFLAGAVAKKGVEFIADAIGAASDLAESTNKVQQIFGDASDEIFKFASTAADGIGQTNEQARAAAATFGIFAKAAGLNQGRAAKFSITMTRLASDLASFSNTSPEQAIEALSAALRGESEPIRAYGVLLDEATLKAEAMRLGILKPVKDKTKILSYQVAVTTAQKRYNDALKEHGKQSLEALQAEASLGTARDRLTKATAGTIPPLTQQQKVLAAQSAILKQTGDAQNDFARTSDGLANQQRRMQARFADAKAELGTGLLPIMNELAGVILDDVLPAEEEFSDWFTKKGAPALRDFIDDAKPVVREWLPKIGDGLQQAADVGKAAAGYVGSLIDAFDQVPDWAQKLIIGGGVAAFSAKKLGLDQLLGKGATAALAPVIARGSRTNPMYVIDLSGGLGPGVGPRTPGVPEEDIDPKTGKRRTTRTRAPRGAALNDVALLLGLPILRDAAAEALGAQRLTEQQLAARARKQAKFGENIGESTASQAARQRLADELSVRISHNLGEGGFFGGIPGTDFLIDDDAKDKLTKALHDATGPALLDLNSQLHETFGVGLPRLAKDGMIDASVIVDLKLAKQQAAFLASQREKVEGFRAGVEGDYTGRFTLLGIDTANQQINGMFDLFMRRNARLQDRFPAGGEGGAQGPPNQSGPGGGTDGGDTRTPTSGRSQQGGVSIANAHFHDWSGHDAEMRRLKRLASVGGRRVGQQVPA